MVVVLFAFLDLLLHRKLESETHVQAVAVWAAVVGVIEVVENEYSAFHVPYELVLLLYSGHHAEYPFAVRVVDLV